MYYYNQVILVGDSKVGNSSFFIRAMKNITPQQSKSTIGVEYASKQIVYKEQLITLKIWDTAGSEKYKSVTSNHFLQSQGALLFYDLTDLYTYENIQNWLKDINYYADVSITIIIVGNKLDLVDDAQNLRCISQDKVQQMCKQQNLLYAEFRLQLVKEQMNQLNFLLRNCRLQKFRMFKSKIDQEKIDQDRIVVIENFDYVCN